MRFPRALAVALLTALLALAACSSRDGDDHDSGGAAAAGDAAAERAASDPAPAKGAAMDAVLQDDPADPADADRAIISTGNVRLHSDDVEQTVFDVVALVDEYGGQVTDRETGTDDEGEVRRARLVLRIPAGRYSQAFADLEKVADLVSSGSSSEDVTTQVIDVDARIRAQRRSLDRVEVLLDRADSIRDIVAIEAQLTRRQADLDSLVKRQASLRDQTSMSTVTVSIDRTAPKKEKDDDRAGFLAGLSDGWRALAGFAVVLVTVAGVLLPWALAALLVGWPLWLLGRRLGLRARIPARTRSDA